MGFPHVGSNQSIVALRKQSNQDNKSMSASAFAVSSLQVPISTSMTARERVLLSTADECHVIEADFSSGNIEVQRYVRRGSRSSLFQNKKLMSYKYHLWSDNSNRFHLMEVPIAPTHYEYNWNYVDQLLCGFHEQFPPNIKYRRQRFALVPQHADGIRFISSESKAEFHFKTFMERMTRQQFGMLNIVFELNDNRDYNRANSTRKFPFTAAHLLQNGFCSFTDSKTGQVRISLDSSRSDRHEWIIIRYESEYAANSVYFIEILWLVASSALVEQYLQDCSLHAKSCGFNMIQVPSRLPSPDPFHIVHSIRLESAAMSKLILNSLLKEWGFVLDRVSKVDFRWQVIHSSGMALIRASESGLNIEWVSNHLLSAQYLRLSCLTLFRAFRRYCNFLNSMRQIAVQMCVQSIEKDNVV